ncbi:MAG: hypothetical protein PHC93_03270 [Candidatus Omnitrophica bacterium]|nr:hypothetical protein [Candidatus Omnitrophota bacterium]
MSTKPIGLCGCYGDGLFRPDVKRRKKHCFGRFMDCLFYQSQIYPIIIKSIRDSKHRVENEILI